MDRTLATMVAAWGLAVLSGSTAGVFAKLPLEVVLAIAAFATAFALGALLLDPELQQYLRRARWLAHAAAMLAFLAILGLAAAPWDARLADFPHALTLLFVLPLALAAATALYERAALTSRAARSPAGHRAAT